MSKYLALYVFVLTALGLAAIELLWSESEDLANACAFVENQQVTNAKVAAHGRFSAVLQATIRALADGKIPLRDACAVVQSEARTHSPIYLHMLSSAEPGNSLEERIAHNLMGHVADRVEAEHIDPAGLRVLQAELNEITHETN